MGAVLHYFLRLGSAAFGVNVLQAGQGGAGGTLRSLYDPGKSFPVLATAVSVPRGDAVRQH